MVRSMVELIWGFAAGVRVGMANEEIPEEVFILKRMRHTAVGGRESCGKGEGSRRK